jgi:hypothetical protein
MRFERQVAEHLYTQSLISDELYFKVCPPIELLKPFQTPQASEDLFMGSPSVSSDTQQLLSEEPSLDE